MNDIQKAQAARILSCYGETENSLIEKGGEGSKGGKIIGHTKSGKPIYESLSINSKHYKSFSSQDHQDAAEFHKDQIAHHENARIEHYGKSHYASEGNTSPFGAKKTKEVQEAAKNAKHPMVNKEAPNRGYDGPNAEKHQHGADSLHHTYEAQDHKKAYNSHLKAAGRATQED